MVNPFIIPAGKAAVAAATKGAATGAAKIAITEKAAKAFAGATKSIESSFETGALQAVENIFTNIKSSGPVLAIMKVITATIQAGTMNGTLELFQTVMNSLQSEGGQTALQGFINFINVIVLGVSDIVAKVQDSPSLTRVINALSHFLSLLMELSLDTVEGLITAIDKILELILAGQDIQNTQQYRADSGDPQTDALVDYYTSGGSFGWF